MSDTVDNKSFYKPLRRRLKELLYSIFASSIIGFIGGLTCIFVCAIGFYGPETFVFGLARALVPESELKTELNQIQSELKTANKKLEEITTAVFKARKLGSNQISVEGRARLSLPSQQVLPNLSNESKSVKKGKVPTLLPAQGGDEGEPLSMLDTLLLRLSEIRLNQVSLSSIEPSEVLNSTPIGVPVSGELTSTYGIRVSPFSGYRQVHRGIDIAMNRGASLFATADGTVTHAGWGGAYGQYVVIDHGTGSDASLFESVYAHLSRIDVKPGSKVVRGTKLGLVGSSGHSTGPHVHYEVRRNGVAIDPEPFVQLANLLD
jgi:murein DD-endopeptidase MepM/ murein hydrolase activator NlpD